ncbi:Hypothetical protein NTJ_03833 [Nesidiocoris tenuis]|uniref:Uncharacterized protein n=1 Tax=Nesidiocoris tenuis TaxID=355587 RepID=A0ABN7AFH1_9HEMI|nr:Hypothetical protein NTJ_03833 [Nesidiocoris tenuis]
MNFNVDFYTLHRYAASTEGAILNRRLRRAASAAPGQPPNYAVAPMSQRLVIKEPHATADIAGGGGGGSPRLGTLATPYCSGPCDPSSMIGRFGGDLFNCSSDLPLIGPTVRLGDTIRRKLLRKP